MTKRSVHFGLNRVSPLAYAGWTGELHGCRNDAQNLAALFGRAWYKAFAFFDQDCTRENFSAQIDWLSANSAPGDQVVISYSGHGSQHLSPQSEDFTIETICLFDGELSDVQFRALRAKFQPGVQVVILLDSCFSGGMNRALKALRPRVMPRDVRLQVFPEKNVLGLGSPSIVSDELLITACGRNQTAGDGDNNGEFTGGLLATFQPGITWGEWFMAMSNKVSNESFQNPCWFQCGATKSTVV